MQLLKGASIFTTGGGIPLRDQSRSLRSLKKISAKILSLDEFEKNDYLCVVAELGPTTASPIKKQKVIARMRSVLEKMTEVKIAGVYAPEIGQESVVLEAANCLKLPIADFNPVGLRAVPYVDVNLFQVNNTAFSYAPMVVCNDSGEIFVVEGDISDARLENILRSLSSLSENKSIFVLGGVVAVRQLLKNNMANSPYSTVFTYGTNKTTKDLLTQLSPRISFAGRVVHKEEKEIQGFFSEVIAFESEEGEIMKLIVLNEVIFLLDARNNLIASVPERILLLSKAEPIGVSCADINIDTEIVVAVIAPEAAWTTKAAQKVFGQHRFKFLLEHSYDK